MSKSLSLLVCAVLFSNSAVASANTGAVGIIQYQFETSAEYFPEFPVFQDARCLDRQCFGDDITAGKFCDIQGYRHSMIIRSWDSGPGPYWRWTGRDWVSEVGTDMNLSEVRCW